MRKIFSFDLDGVIFNGPDMPALMPRIQDIIITGRSFEERGYTDRWLMCNGIINQVYYNPLKFSEKSRETSAQHKVDILKKKPEVVIHYEDDPVQAKIIREACPEVCVILIDNPLVEKENVWRGK